MRKPIMAITAGDPGGIGSEVIAKAFRQCPPEKNFTCLLIGSHQAFDFLAKKQELQFPLNRVKVFEPSSFCQDKVNFLDITDDAFALFEMIRQRDGHQKNISRGEFVFEIGKISLPNACISYESLRAAAELAASGMIEGIVTAPVNKTALRLVDPDFHGHTDYLAKMSGVQKYAMMFVHSRLKVTLVTVHVPLKKVSALIQKKEVFEKIRLTDHFLRTSFNLREPRIGVCALNPHGREMGTEEDAEIAPAVLQARKRKIRVTGPHSADQLFHDAYEGRYDAVVSMYHDQGLAPFKMIAFRDGVNMTLGLPFIRTSPDHGTAFDIAYRNEADPASMMAAIRLAGDLLFPARQDHPAGMNEGHDSDPN